MRTSLSTNRVFLHRLLLLALAAMASGCDVTHEYPVDPEGTLDRVRGDVLRVGVIHAPPWTLADGAAPAGLEPELVHRLAAQLGAEIEWQRGAPDQLLALLEEHELDILIGGFELHSPATGKVGTTRPYAGVDWWVVASDPTATGSIEGKRVLIRHGRAAALVREAGAIPVLWNDSAGESGLRAIPVVSSRMAVPGYPVRKIGSSRHVLAVPPGENAWVVAVDRSLRGWQDERSARGLPGRNKWEEAEP